MGLHQKIYSEIDGDTGGRYLWNDDAPSYVMRCVFFEVPGGHHRIEEAMASISNCEMTTRWCPPPVIDGFISPLTIDISPINHSYWTYKPT